MCVRFAVRGLGFRLFEADSSMAGADGHHGGGVPRKGREHHNRRRGHQDGRRHKFLPQSPISDNLYCKTLWALTWQNFSTGDRVPVLLEHVHLLRALLRLKVSLPLLCVLVLLHLLYRAYAAA